MPQSVKKILYNLFKCSMQIKKTGGADNHAGVLMFLLPIGGVSVLFRSKGEVNMTCGCCL